MERLTKSEEELMDIFWTGGEPYTSVDIVKMDVKPTWGNGLVSNMLRSLFRKGYLQECGMKQYVTQYAREFKPSVGREDYAAAMALAAGKDKVSVPGVVLSLVKQSKKTDIIAELEEVVLRLKDEGREAKEAKEAKEKEAENKED